MKGTLIEEHSIIVSTITILAIEPWAFVGFDNVPHSAIFQRRKSQN